VTVIDSPATYGPAEQRRILALAREVTTKSLRDGEVAEVTLGRDEAFLRELRGCFVTLKHPQRGLRGCIGTFTAEEALWINIVKMGQSALRDPRFVQTQPVRLAELPELLIEVSVLTPMQPIDDPLQMRLGIDGIYILATSRGRSGCFLPQVPVEQGWTVEQTLSACCAHKMGLTADAWRSPGDLQFSVFQSTIIAESAPGEP